MRLAELIGTLSLATDSGTGIILEKLHVTTRAAAAIYAMQHGITA